MVNKPPWVSTSHKEQKVAELASGSVGNTERLQVTPSTELEPMWRLIPDEQQHHDHETLESEGLKAVKRGLRGKPHVEPFCPGLSLVA